MRKLALAVVCGVILILLGCMGLIAPLDILVNLLFGWAVYLYRVVPQVTVSWPGVFTAVVCLVGLAVGLHLFLRWLGSRVGPWRRRWTAAVLGVVVLMFVAGISAAGVAHQTGWLLTSPEPLITRSSGDIGGRIWSLNNLKGLSLAMQNYQDEKGSLPPAAVLGKDGQPLLSWRVLLLPYAEEEALYREFRLDEPWDSPHNLRLLARMPKVYSTPHPPAKGPAYTTSYKVFVGKGAAFERGHRLKLPDDFPDGTSNTILVIEAGDPVPWTKPDDLPFDPDVPLLPLAGPFPFYLNVVMADASCRSLDPKTLTESTLRAAVTRNGGDELGPDW
jgi:hypothetical protein